MSNIINIENITKSFTGRKLFCKASFSVQENEKIGIVGINGTGKSTLLKIIAGQEEPEEGNVVRANHLVVNYLPQLPEFEEGHSVLESVMHGAIVHEGDEANRWTLESEAKSLLMRLGIVDMNQRTAELSGGQRKRVALVAAVLKPCDVLILDEPTNHLDYDMVEWLEDYLRRFRGAIIMVTHDRYFLDSVCNRIVEIDKGSIYSYDTNYSGFLERKVAREESQMASERKRQSILRNEIAWMQRGARARSTKQKAHIQRYEALRDQAGPQVAAKLEMASVSTRMGRSTIELEHVSKAFDRMVCVKDFSYIFLKNDRIGFVGKNGCGKTTLMKMIAGFMEPDSGEIRVGQTVRIGYYCQEIYLTTDKNAQTNEGKYASKFSEATETSWMDPEERVIDYIKNTAEYVKTKDGTISASAMLERFLFEPEQQYSPIGKLSGGERRRLNLLRVLMESPNVLILDEPTNDLDTQTLAILEDYLDGFEGIVITVSHDRYFLDRIVQRIFAFEGDGRIVQYEGGYTDYMEKRPKEQAGADIFSTGEKRGEGQVQKAQDSRASWTHEKKLKFTYKEEREYETIESEIAELEEKLEKIDGDMMANASNAGKLNALNQEKEETEALLLEKMERWEYLEDLAQRIAEQNRK
ncbi:MAG: ABC-F family ATP-binding cassette domain-containing protein [Lachnospiraceae bacterium]|nr:ABC-F family ATP-binding cassette domain-containing protein [Lachnospiraceae bacterium]